MNRDSCWMLCTSCLSRPVTDLKFYLASCSHLLCERCVNLEQPYCKRCSRATSVIAVDSNMPDNVRDLLNDQTSRIKNLVRAMDFQELQTNHLINYYRQIEEKYTTSKAFVKDLLQKKNMVAAVAHKRDQQLKEANGTIETLRSKITYYENKFRSRSETGHFGPFGTPNLSLELDDHCRRRHSYNPPMELGNFPYRKRQSPFAGASSTRTVPSNLSMNSEQRCHSYNSPMELGNFPDRKRQSPFASEASFRTAPTNRSINSDHSNPRSGQTQSGVFQTPTSKTAELLSFLHSSQRLEF